MNSRSELFYIGVKITLIYIFAFLGKYKYQWIIIILLLVLSGIGYTNYSYNWPYFNDRMNKFFSVLWAVFFWGNAVLLLAKILENTEFSGAL